MRQHLKDRHEVAHYWANQVQASGEASAFSFRGPGLFSYSTCIARILSTGAVAWTYRSFSITTTSKHMGPARSAANHRQGVFCYDPQSSAASNMSVERTEVAQLLKRAEQAFETKKDGTQSIRSKNKQDQLRGAALNVARRANAYLDAMYAAGLASAKDVKAIDTDNLGIVLEGLKKAEAAQKRARDREAKERAKRQAKEAEEAKADLEAWRGGAAKMVAGFRSLPCALRLVAPASRQQRSDGQIGYLTVEIYPDTKQVRQIVETSHGASIPVEDAIKLWPLLLRVRNGEGSWVCDPRSRERKLGPYTLNEIKANGDIAVGCHQISFDEMEKIAKQLGLIKGEEA